MRTKFEKQQRKFAKGLYNVRTKPQLIASLNGIKQTAKDFPCDTSTQILKFISKKNIKTLSKKKLIDLIVKVEEYSIKQEDKSRDTNQEYYDENLFLLDHDINVILNPMAYDVEDYINTGVLTKEMFDETAINLYWANNRPNYTETDGTKKENIQQLKINLIEKLMGLPQEKWDDDDLKKPIREITRVLNLLTRKETEYLVAIFERKPAIKMTEKEMSHLNSILENENILTAKIT